jgi:hypothetical protein
MASTSCTRDSGPGVAVGATYTGVGVEVGGRGWINVGVGDGVGVDVGVDVGVEVGVDVGVAVGDGVDVGVAVEVAVGVWVAVAVGVWVAVLVAVDVGIDVAVANSLGTPHAVSKRAKKARPTHRWAVPTVQYLAMSGAWKAIRELGGVPCGLILMPPHRCRRILRPP